MGLIDAEETRETIRNKALGAFNLSDAFEYYLKGLMDADGVIANASTVDAEPVRHGMWMWHSVIGEAFYVKECSVCGWTHALNSNYLYCPNCGAKMDKEKDDG